jgi:hypothetical protein
MIHELRRRKLTCFKTQYFVLTTNKDGVAINDKFQSVKI